MVSHINHWFDLNLKHMLNQNLKACLQHIDTLQKILIAEIEVSD